MKLIFSILLFFSCPKLYSQSFCENIDFEDGDTTQWYTQGDVKIVNLSEEDPFGLFPLATSGFFSVKLGTELHPNQSTIKRSIYIDQETKYFIYSYALVLLGMDHSEEEAARVDLKITDENGQIIPCAAYSAVARPLLSDGFFQSDSVYEGLPVFYKPWITNAVDLSMYIGQTLTFEISNRWCIYDVHFGYSYIDAYCTSQIINAFKNCTNGNYYIRTVEGFQDYLWEGPGIVNGIGTNVIEVNQPGIYTVHIPNPNPECDSIHLETNVTMNELADIPVANFSATSVCIGDTALLYGQCSTLNPIENQLWIINGIAVGTGITQQIVLDSDEQLMVTYVVTNASGCSDSVTKPLNVYGFPSVDLGKDLLICPGQSVELRNLNSSETGLIWSTGETEPVITVHSAGWYYAMSTNGFCSKTDSVFVDMGNMYLGKIPNVITPNYDNVNDVLEIQSENLLDYHLVIFNRWGNTVVETSDPMFYWDGTVNGVSVDEGVYYYQLTYGCENEDLKKQGFVEVIR